MHQLTTAGGHVFDCTYFNASPMFHQLTIQLANTTVVDVATVFCNPEETTTLGYGELVEAGYTKLRAIIPQKNEIRILLEKE